MMSRKYPKIIATSVVLLILCMSIGATAAETELTRPERAGMSAAKLARIAPAMEKYIDKGHVPGCVTLVAHHGKTVHFESHGLMDTDRGIPMKNDTIFRIASMTKPITAVAALILYEEGAFLLTDPVSDYIPAFKNMRVLEKAGGNGAPDVFVPAERQITIRHLMNHTSGITYGGGALASYYKKAGVTSGLKATDGTIGDMVEKLATCPLAHQPGEQWSYGLSNDVLGRVIEVVSGMPLDAFIQTRICEPLGMTDTSFYPSRDSFDRVATMYIHRNDGTLAAQTPEERAAILEGPRTYFSGGGGLFSTAPDYIRFATMLLNGGELDGVRIIGRKTVELMTTDSTGGIDILKGTGHTRATHGDRYGLGIGIRAIPGDIESVGTFGWGGAFNTLMWIDPEEELIGIFMSQVAAMPDKTQHRVFRIIAYSAIGD